MTEPHAGLSALANPALIAPHVQAVPTSTAKTQNGPRVQLAAYIDARAVAEILDRIVGPENWSFEKSGPEQAEKGWICHGRLTVYADGRDVIREDIGGGSGDIETGGKGAVSDALKRCAVQFGLGRALYRLDHAWIAGREDKRGRVQPDKDEVAKVVARWRKDLMEQGTVPALAQSASVDEEKEDAQSVPPTPEPSVNAPVGQVASPQQRAGLKKRAESKGIDIIQLLKDEFDGMVLDQIPADKVADVIDRLSCDGKGADDALEKSRIAQQRYQDLLARERDDLTRADINKILRDAGVTEQMDLLDDALYAKCAKAIGADSGQVALV